MDNIYLDTKRIHKDVLKRLNKINKPQRYLTEKLGISRSTFFRLQSNHEMKVNTLLKIADWLEKDISEYIIKTRNNNQLNTLKNEKSNKN